MIPKIIAVTGKLGVGKDTLANMIINHTGGCKLSFAFPIKVMLEELISFIEDSPVPNTHTWKWDSREWKETPIEILGKSPAQLAQTLGTNWGRDLVDPDIWVKLLEARMRMMSHLYSTFIISDLRFDNEADMLKKYGATIIHITRANQETSRDTLHRSEAGISQSYITDYLYNDFATVEAFVEYSKTTLKNRGIIS